jgi:hypothetical protein
LAPLFRHAGPARWLATAIVAVSLLAVCGCRHGQDPENAPSAVHIVNAVQNAGNLSAKIDGKQVFGGVGFGSDSGLCGVDAGHYNVAVAVSPNGQPVWDAKESVDIEKGRHYTAVAYGIPFEPGHVTVFSIVKTTDAQRKKAEASGKASVRVFNAAAGAQKIDVLVNSIVAFKNVSYGDRSEAIPLAALPYEWSIKPAGDSDDVYGSPVTIGLKSGHNYVVVVMGSIAGSDLLIKAFEE